MADLLYVSGPPFGSMKPLIIDTDRKTSSISFHCVKICRRKLIEKLDVQKSMDKLDFVLRIEISVGVKLLCICIHSISVAL